MTAVELLPVHHFVSEPHLLRRGLTNYWGYNTLGFFAPHAAYSASGSGGGQVTEFKRMVKALHAAGIEVILDVVYNHTAEGDQTGPTLSLKGIDNAGYYRLDGADPARYTDFTGCGNTLDVRRSAVLGLLIDSLRYWVTEMHVDGFRFDLAPGAGPLDARRRPVLRLLRRGAPGPGGQPGEADRRAVGRRAGRLPGGQLPAAVDRVERRLPRHRRDVWAGAHVGVRDLAYRLTGSSDLYRSDGRRPFASINFVTAHDGFTMRDLVSYEQQAQRGQRRGQPGRRDDNRSWNCGVEGETDDAEVNALRARQVRNLLATLLLSTGVPMLVAGDELGRTQRGNNNAYCQDNELSWVDWTAVDGALRGVRRPRADGCAAPRRCCGRRRSSRATSCPGTGGTRDLAWFAPDGGQLTTADWFDTGLQTIGMYLDGAAPAPSARGRPVVDDSYLIWLHAGAGAAHRAAARRAVGRRLRAGRLDRVPHRRPPGDGRSSPPAPSSCPAAASGCSGSSAAPDGVPSEAQSALHAHGPQPPEPRGAGRRSVPGLLPAALRLPSGVRGGRRVLCATTTASSLRSSRRRRTSRSRRDSTSGSGCRTRMRSPRCTRR